MKKDLKLLFSIVIISLISACEHSDEENSATTQITSFELFDPTPGAGDGFGQSVAVLTNGNIVVSDPFDSSIISRNGAIHLYNPTTQSLIASTYGDTTDDFLGWAGGYNTITALSNGNFVIRSPFDDVAGVFNAGSVMLFNGTTGTQIGSTVAGLGWNSITALSNGNFVIASPNDDVADVVSAGSVMLINGITGEQIGNTNTGNAQDDQLGLGGITELSNGNYVIVSLADDVAGVGDAGSVMLINGITGTQIGGTITGDNLVDHLGSGGITTLINGNFVITSPVDDVAGVGNAGSVMLINGITGAQIGSTVTGNALMDQLGSGGVTELSNDNYVIVSPDDDIAAFNAGSVILVNGMTGTQIGSTFTGNAPNDQLGLSGVTALTNDNFVIASSNDEVAGVNDAGSIILVNGTTGVQIGSTIAGDVLNDQLGLTDVTALTNDNFVIASSNDDVAGVSDAGSVMLINGTTGAQIGSTIKGDMPNDRLGLGGVTALTNDNFVIVSFYDEVAGVAGAGSVTLVNGTTGSTIGTPIAGDTFNDFLGWDGVTALANSNFVIASSGDDVAGVAGAGSVMLINGTNGTQIGNTIEGSVTGDIEQIIVRGSATGDYYVLGLVVMDNNGLTNSGMVRLIAP